LTLASIKGILYFGSRRASVNGFSDRVRISKPGLRRAEGPVIARPTKSGEAISQCKDGEIAALPLVARNDNAVEFNLNPARTPLTGMRSGYTSAAESRLSACE